MCGRWICRCSRGLAHACASTHNAGEMWEEWRYFERHLVTRSREGHGGCFDEINFISPWVEFYTSTERQGCDLIKFIFVEHRRLFHDGSKTNEPAFFIGEAVAK